MFGADVELIGQSRIGDGLVGMNLRLALRSDHPEVPSSVVVKLPSPDETSRATGIALRNYEREVKFYREIASTIDIHVPQCHHAWWDEQSGDFVIVLEDLAPQQQGDQIAGCSADVAAIAVLELARLHGPRWGDPSLGSIDWLSRYNGPEDAALLATMWSMFVPGFLTTYGERLTAESIGLIERFGGRVAAWVEGRIAPGTVVHGDYRLDNLMFASPAGGAPISTVDWQSPGHGSGLGDVSYFLGAGPLPEVRRVIERSLVIDYADRLRGDYGVAVDDGWAWQQYRYNAFAGVVMAVIASQVVGGTARSEGMFAAMATRHVHHALDLDSESLIP